MFHLLRKSSGEMKPEEQKAIIYSICRTNARHSAAKLDCIRCYNVAVMLGDKMLFPVFMCFCTSVHLTTG